MPPFEKKKLFIVLCCRIKVVEVDACFIFFQVIKGNWVMLMGIDEIIYDVVRGGIRATSATFFTRMLELCKNKKTPPNGLKNLGSARKKKK